MSKFTETIGKAANKVTESTKNWNWGAIGAACAITGMIISGIANVATKKQNQKAIDEAASKAAVDAVKALLNGHQHHTDG